MTVRFFMLQSHYSSTLDFSNEALNAAEKGFKKLSNALLLIKKLTHPGGPLKNSSLNFSAQQNSGNDCDPELISMRTIAIVLIGNTQAHIFIIRHQCLEWFFFWNWIISESPPWMTPQYSFSAKPNTFNDAPLQNGFNGVLRACGCMTAIGTNQW